MMRCLFLSFVPAYTIPQSWKCMSTAQQGVFFLLFHEKQDRNDQHWYWDHAPKSANITTLTALSWVLKWLFFLRKVSSIYKVNSS